MIKWEVCRLGQLSCIVVISYQSWTCAPTLLRWPSQWPLWQENTEPSHPLSSRYCHHVTQPCVTALVDGASVRTATNFHKVPPDGLAWLGSLNSPACGRESCLARKVVHTLCHSCRFFFPCVGRGLHCLFTFCTAWRKSAFRDKRVGGGSIDWLVLKVQLPFVTTVWCQLCYDIGKLAQRLLLSLWQSIR